jgi:broad specificity phosphatase PhoE
MTIYIVRHGETDFNRLGIVQGSGVDSDLNQNGLHQAQLLYDHYKDVKFEKIMTSALKRTHQTVAQFIAQDPSVWVQLPELNEISWGESEGKKGDDKTKAAYVKLMSDWETGVYETKLAGGESAAELQERVQKAVDYLWKNDFQGKNVLICTHGRTLLCLLTVLQNTPLSKMNDFKHQNTCIYLAHYRNGSFEFELSNDVQHLKGFETVAF